MAQIYSLDAARGMSTKQILQTLDAETQEALRDRVEKTIGAAFCGAIYVIGPSEAVPIRVGDNRPKEPVAFMAEPNTEKVSATILGRANRYNWHEIRLLGQRKFATVEDARLVLAQVEVLTAWEGMPLKIRRRANGEDRVLWSDMSCDVALETIDRAAKIEGIEAWTPESAREYVQSAILREMSHRA
jgi:hypothetical protein